MPDRPDTNDAVAKITSLVQGALDTWPKTLRLCLVIVAIALLIAAWKGLAT